MVRMKILTIIGCLVYYVLPIATTFYNAISIVFQSPSPNQQWKTFLEKAVTQ